MISRNIPLSHLLDLLMVTRSGSINKAAELLNVTQPALTRSIKRLEDQLGVALLIRTPAGIVPTEFGKTLMPHLQKVESQLRQGFMEVESLRDGSSGRVSFGITPIFGQDIIPTALSRFVRHWPRLSVEVAEGGTDAHFELLRSGRYDFVLGPVSNEEREPDFFQEELFTDQVGIFIRPGNPLCQRQNLSLHDLIQCDWILPPVGAQLRPRLENLFRNEGLELPPFAIETGTLHIVKRLLVTTDMVGAIARMIIKPELRRGELVELKGSWNFIHRPFGVYWRKGYPLSAAARELILNIKAAIRELDLRPETKN